MDARAATRYSGAVNDSIFDVLAAAAHGNEPVALGIITGVKGSSPQKVGAKAVFFPGRKIKGTLGGGCLEAEVQRLALQALRDGKPQAFEFILDHDFGWDDGLICGGKVLGVIVPDAQKTGERFWRELAGRDGKKTWGITADFAITRLEEGAGSFSSEDWRYRETIEPPCALWIAGSGHIAQAVAPLAVNLDFAVTLFDDRPELANHEFFPREVSLRTGNWGDLLQTPFPSAPAFGLIVTRGHQHDALVLETWIHRPFHFLGMIGSARKARTITEHFINAKIATAAEVARVACPVGLKIRSQSVPEIAVSILAQYIERRAAMRMKGTPASCNPAPVQSLSEAIPG